MMAIAAIKELGYNFRANHLATMRAKFHLIQ